MRVTSIAVKGESRIAKYWSAYKWSLIAAMLYLGFFKDFSDTGWAQLMLYFIPVYLYGEVMRTSLHRHYAKTNNKIKHQEHYDGLAGYFMIVSLVGIINSLSIMLEWRLING